MDQQPKNVAAVLAWYHKYRPDMVKMVEDIFALRNKRGEAMQALLLQGFEAGREFEREHPEIKSGMGYLNLA